MARYTFDVGFATDKDSLMAGQVVAGTHRVAVDADGFLAAMLTAEMMVAASGREPTSVEAIDFPLDSR